MQPILAAHTRFGRHVRLSVDSVARFAEACGDSNPVHRAPADGGCASGRPVIASSAQSSGLLMGAVAGHVCPHAAMLGLEFAFVFRAPVPAEQDLQVEWLVIRSTPTSNRRDHVVDLRGRLRLADGPTAVGASGKVLVRGA